MQKITPFLWFDHQAEEAAEFYVSIFKNSKINQITRYGEGMPVPSGTVMTVEFQLDEQTFLAMNGGPHHPFTDAISFMVNCETQEEVDHYWERLSDGGTEIQCGWLKDRYGLSWQITPVQMMQYLYSDDASKVQRAMSAMMSMVKLDIAKLQAAAEGPENT